jgi:hypothetical protein
MERQPHDTQLKAVIYLPTVDTGRWERICLAWCEAKNYLVVGRIFETGDGTAHASMVAMLSSGEADIGVVGSLDHLPPDRVPRVEVAQQQHPVTGQPPAQRRARRVRWSGQ